MHQQPALFHVTPSHVYVAAHWALDGWVVTFSWSTGSPEGLVSSRETYGPLNGPELLDVLGAELAHILGG